MSSSLHQRNILFMASRYPSVPLKTPKLNVSYCCFCNRPRTRPRSTISKRKPRPSFYDQAGYKWSQKQSSEREKFPWQQVIAKEQKPSNLEADEVGDNASDLDADALQGVSEFSLNSNVQLPSMLPPWTNGNSLIHPNGDSKSQYANEFGNVFEDVGEMIDDEFEAKFDVANCTKAELSEEHNDIQAIERFKKIDESFKSTKNTKTTDSVVGPSSFELPWKAGDHERDRTLKRSHTESAERLLSENELKRLRKASLRMVERFSVKRAGITQALVDEIHQKWKIDEVVKLKFEEPFSQNMKRMHDLLELRTGGLVIWRSGSSVVLYRGVAYKFQCVKSFIKKNKNQSGSMFDDETNLFPEHNAEAIQLNSKEPSRRNDNAEDIMDFDELDRLLNDLGPRFTDWSGSDPIPVDADLLPTTVPGYKTPPRALPHGVKRTINEEEMTTFRRSARRVPPHFALGRNSGLQGLANAMAKLWERSAIAKIAIKRGVLHTRNAKMADELKMLTEGTLLSRNKDYIVFYRGNDFLPSSVIGTLTERQKQTFLRQDDEEDARSRAPTFIETQLQHSSGQFIAGTLTETEAANSRWEKNAEAVEDIENTAALRAASSKLAHLKKKLDLATRKAAISERRLEKVERNMDPAELNSDLEIFNEEERVLHRKMGLSMKPYLVVGTRGVFDGTIENMHLHWKHRELVKIIVKRQDIEKVKEIATTLEAESGGMLVSVDKTSKGYAVIVFRGKNYRSPAALKPANLLTRRQALLRSTELQRHQALVRHCSDLQQEIESREEEVEKLDQGIGVNVP